MQLLKDRIKKDGKVSGDNIVNVSSFLNHQLDIELFNEIGREFRRRFADIPVTKILTIESSGIAIACITAQYFGVPVIFAKKHEAKNLERAVYESLVFSYTKNKPYRIRVAQEFMQPEDHVLIIDDFLACGQAVAGLIDLVEQAGAKVAGVGIVIEKAFQKGRSAIESNAYRIESLAVIESLENGRIVFR